MSIPGDQARHWRQRAVKNTTRNSVPENLSDRRADAYVMPKRNEKPAETQSIPEEAQAPRPQVGNPNFADSISSKKPVGNQNIPEQPLVDNGIPSFIRTVNEEENVTIDVSSAEETESGDDSDSQETYTQPPVDDDDDFFNYMRNRRDVIVVDVNPYEEAAAQGDGVPGLACAIGVDDEDKIVIEANPGEEGDAHGVPGFPNAVEQYDGEGIILDLEPDEDDVFAEINPNAGVFECHKRTPARFFLADPGIHEQILRNDDRRMRAERLQQGIAQEPPGRQARPGEDDVPVKKSVDLALAGPAGGDEQGKRDGANAHPGLGSFRFRDGNDTRADPNNLRYRVDDGINSQAGLGNLRHNFGDTGASPISRRNRFQGAGNDTRATPSSRRNRAQGAGNDTRATPSSRRNRARGAGNDSRASPSSLRHRVRYGGKNSDESDLRASEQGFWQNSPGAFNGSQITPRSTPRNGRNDSSRQGGQGNWRYWTEATVCLTGLPWHVHLSEIYDNLSRYGVIVGIEKFRDEDPGPGVREEQAICRVLFRPPPSASFWTHDKLALHEISKAVGKHKVWVHASLEQRQNLYSSPMSESSDLPGQRLKTVTHFFPDSLKLCTASGNSEITMTREIHPSLTDSAHGPLVQIDLRRKEITAEFAYTHGGDSAEKSGARPDGPDDGDDGVTKRSLEDTPDEGKKHLLIDVSDEADDESELIEKEPEAKRSEAVAKQTLNYRVVLGFGEVSGYQHTDINPERTWSLVLHMRRPPILLVRGGITGSFQNHMTKWERPWNRLSCFVDQIPNMTGRPVAFNMRCEDPGFCDVGRCTSIAVSMDSEQSGFVIETLRQHGIPDLGPGLCIEPKKNPQLWPILDNQNFDFAARLPFKLHYALEVVISHGLINEFAVGREFVDALLTLSPALAERMLGHLVEKGIQVREPMHLIRDAHTVWDLATVIGTSRNYVRVRKAVVTPTTIRVCLSTPEHENRVLRQFSHVIDRFLRVQFAEEGGTSRITPQQLCYQYRQDDVYERLRNCLVNGILVGGRRYEFLAFGNSQLREHCVYFFAPGPDLDCDGIRAWMGNFSGITNVAKYGSRLGQCFSSTRPMKIRWAQIVRNVPDIERNGFCFTDGVGLVSVAMAQMMENQLRPSSMLDPNMPSAFQIRLGGSKGVVAVWPDLAKKFEIKLRNSQTKFATHFEDVEIIRSASLSPATLNRQTIALLEALGVPGDVFLDLLHEQTADLEETKTNSPKAAELLRRSVDMNRTTLDMALMVKHGFLSPHINEPFVANLMGLWRSWTLRLIKDKARLTVPKSAFVLGIADETGKLRGHFRAAEKKHQRLRTQAQISAERARAARRTQANARKNAQRKKRKQRWLAAKELQQAIEAEEQPKGAPEDSTSCLIDVDDTKLGGLFVDGMPNFMDMNDDEVQLFASVPIGDHSDDTPNLIDLAGATGLGSPKSRDGKKMCGSASRLDPVENLVDAEGYGDICAEDLGQGGQGGQRGKDGPDRGGDDADGNGEDSAAPEIPEEKWTVEDLPQIFLQTATKPEFGAVVNRVITGICIVGRHPSLHPGDIRVCQAVDVPELHHLKNVVVFPTTGDRDVPSMLSGGDLDGDDYFVIWDERLIPPTWYYPPLSTSPPGKAPESTVPVGPESLKHFIVDYIKGDCLGPVAVAHMAACDYFKGGALDPKSIMLAEQHSMAVDFPKTGKQCDMSKVVPPPKWPHFMERQRGRSYVSTKPLGRIYDEVTKEQFRPARGRFDPRILKAYKPNPEEMEAARKLKAEYDRELRLRIKEMGVVSEFEFWSGFAMTTPKKNPGETSHSQQELLGRERDRLRVKYGARVRSLAGDGKYSSFARAVVTLYWVTRDEALAEPNHPLVDKTGGPDEPQSNEDDVFGNPLVMQPADYGAPVVESSYFDDPEEPFTDGDASGEFDGGKYTPVGRSGENDPFVAITQMPLISFPWIFHGTLGRIAFEESITEGDRRGLRDWEILTSTRYTKEIVEAMKVEE